MKKVSKKVTIKYFRLYSSIFMWWTIKEKRKS